MCRRSIVFPLLLFFSANAIYCNLDNQKLKNLNGIEYEYLFHSKGQSGSNKFTVHYLYVKNIEMVLNKNRNKLFQFATKYSNDNGLVDEVRVFNTNNIDPESINFNKLVVDLCLRTYNDQWYIYRVYEYSDGRKKRKCVNISVDGLESECN
jgi:hypothetical protein